MKNREAYKDKLDNILGEVVAVVDGKPALCAETSCCRCLFLVNCGKPEHKKEIIDWLNAEYQELSVDWSKVPDDGARDEAEKLEAENQRLKSELIESTVRAKVMTEQYNTLLERFCDSLR